MVPLKRMQGILSACSIQAFLMIAKYPNIVARKHKQGLLLIVVTFHSHIRLMPFFFAWSTPQEVGDY